MRLNLGQAGGFEIAADGNAVGRAGIADVAIHFHERLPCVAEFRLQLVAAAFAIVGRETGLPFDQLQLLFQAGGDRFGLGVAPAEVVGLDGGQAREQIDLAELELVDK